MEKYIIILILILCFTQETLADINFRKYLVKGIILNESNEIQKNVDILIQQGKFFRLAKTNNNGEFITELTYTIPCTSGRKVNFNDAEIVKEAENYNGTEMFVLIKGQNMGAIIDPIWKDYYLENKTISDTTILKISANENEVMNNNKVKLIESNYSSDRSIIESYNIGEYKYFTKYDSAIEGILEYVELRGLNLKEAKLKTGLDIMKFGANKAEILIDKGHKEIKAYVLSLNGSGVIYGVKVERRRSD